MKYKFCPICGKELEEKYSWDEGGVPYCADDNLMFFETPKPCVVVAVVNDDKILLLKQSYIFKNSKVLLSGYVGIDETVEETVYREVKEEAGIDIEEVRYLGSDFVKNREILMLTFMAKYAKGSLVKSEEVEALEWISIEDALCQMTEDEIGKRVVRKVLDQVGYNGDKAFRCEDDHCKLR